METPAGCKGGLRSDPLLMVGFALNMVLVVVAENVAGQYVLESLQRKVSSDQIVFDSLHRMVMVDCSDTRVRDMH